MQKFRPLIPIQDYVRIARIITTVVESAEKNSATACIYFSVIGAAILKKVYKKDALPVAGLAIYNIGSPDGRVMMYGKEVDNELSSSDDAFHCWTMCEGYAIDFMAPLFRESWAFKGHQSQCPRKMFQKPLSAMAQSPYLLRNEGDFYIEPNVEMTKELNMEFAMRPGIQDLTHACLTWFKRPPKPIPSSLGLLNDLGKAVEMRLKPLEIVGTW